MTECKTIIFEEDINDPGMGKIADRIRLWYDLNKEHITKIHSIYNRERDENSPSQDRKLIIIHYEGDGGLNPYECPHLHEREDILNPPLCEVIGNSDIYCDDCKIYLRHIQYPELGHSYTYASNNDATCEADGTQTGTCIRCGRQILKSDPGTAMGHNREWTVDTPATCLEDRVDIGTCSRCGDYIYDIIEGTALGHNHVWTYDNNATCLNDGTETGKCIRCPDTLHRIKPNTALGHNHVWTYDNNATCLEDGTETGRCSRCTDTLHRVKPNTALGHNYVWSVDKEATCLENKIDVGICSRCGDLIYKTIEGTALGHTYPNEWTIRTQPTEQATGLKFKKCIRCNNEITESIPKLTHVWTSNGNGTHTCHNNGCNITETCSPNNYGDTCSKCGYHTPEDINLQITTSFVNGMTKGTAFTQNLTCNVTVDYTWSISAGSLPPGISLSSKGALTGTPTTAGIFTFTVKLVYHLQTITKQFSINVANTFVTVTFNANGGTCSEKTRQVAEGGTIGTLPTATRNGYNFGGWFTASTGGLKVDSSYAVSNNITLYARWGEGSDVEFGEATTQFNIQVNGDRTNYNNNPYTLYGRIAGGAAGTVNLEFQTGIDSINGTNNITTANKKVVLYLKVTNNGAAGNFDIGFDADSYVVGNDNDQVKITRISNGLSFANGLYTCTVPYVHTAWAGTYNQRVENRYNNSALNTSTGTIDTGFAFTMNNIFINSGSYAILEVTFQMP